MFGNNDCHQCGIKKRFKIFLPNKLNININDDKIIDIKCGFNHTIIKTITNKFYSFGSNKNNQLCLTNNNKRKVLPTLISNEFIKSNTKCDGNIIDIIPGFDNSYILQQT